VTCFIVNCEMI